MGKISARAGWAVAGALAVALLLVAAKVIQAGPLDPPGPVGSTMKTLADLAPSWHQTLTSNGCGSARWTCVMGNAAALDNETGLVWEKSPLWSGTDSWYNAQTLCTSDPTGGRYGWRLPTASELLTLKDSNTLDLVAGNPFTGVADYAFWSSTSAPGDAFKARYIFFSPFASNEQVALKADATVAGIWCLRGGRTDDPQVPDDPASWLRTLPANDGIDSCSSSRFTCVLGNAAVLDHETGLVWERDPNSKGFGNWAPAIDLCYGMNLGGRTGWRPATMAELMSLLDQSQVNPSVSLPPGHPFLNVSNDIFWSATEFPDSPSNAYVVGFRGIIQGVPGGKSYFLKTGSSVRAWCVRGADTQ